MCERDTTPVLKGSKCINKFNLLSYADRKPPNIWLQIIRKPAASDALSAAADGRVLMPFSYTLLCEGNTQLCFLT